MSAGTGVPSGGANEPTGLGTLNVPDSAQVCCQARSMSPASVAVYRCWGVSAPPSEASVTDSLLT